MYKCQHCGHVFTEPKTVQEYRGEFWGMPAYEDVSVCPHCGSDDVDWEYKGEEEEGTVTPESCCGDCVYYQAVFKDGDEYAGCQVRSWDKDFAWNDGYMCPHFEKTKEDLLAVVYEKGDL